MARFFQYHPSIPHADAIGYSMRRVDELLAKAGHRSIMVCADSERHISGNQAAPLSQLLSTKYQTDDRIIVHFSFFDPQLERLATLPQRKMLVYHNVTPGHFFQEVGQSGIASLCDAAREQLRQNIKHFDLAVGVSDFNSEELIRFGAPGATTVPIFYNDGFFSSDAFDADFFAHLKTDPRPSIAFVGRAVPNKRIDRIIDIMAAYQRLFGTPLTFHLVGKIWDEHYFVDLLRTAANANVLREVRIHGELTTLRLKTLMKAVDAFVSMSEHEGFMVPILECFSAGCPVVALRTTAVKETMGDAGIGLDHPDPALAAAHLRTLRVNRRFRGRQIERQAQRAAHFRSERTAAKWRDTIDRLVEGK